MDVSERRLGQPLHLRRPGAEPEGKRGRDLRITTSSERGERTERDLGARIADSAHERFASDCVVAAVLQRLGGLGRTTSAGLD